MMILSRAMFQSVCGDQHYCYMCALIEVFHSADHWPFHFMPNHHVHELMIGSHMGDDFATYICFGFLLLLFEPKHQGHCCNRWMLFEHVFNNLVTYHYMAIACVDPSRHDKKTEFFQKKTALYFIFQCKHSCWS